MYISHHNTIALSHERISDLHRDAAKIRLEREARSGNEKAAVRTFSFSSILRKFAPAASQLAAESAVRTTTLRHA